MKLNKLTAALILSMGMSAFGAHAEEAQTGRVTFTGSIVDAACSIAPDTENQEVALGSIAAASLENEGSSRPRAFQIKLENCAISSDDDSGTKLSAAKAVSVTFDGVADLKNNKLLGISGAKGAGVQITNAGGQNIELGKPTSLYNLTAGTNILDFNGNLKGNKDAVETGAFTSIANFTMNYE